MKGSALGMVLGMFVAGCAAAAGAPFHATALEQRAAPAVRPPEGPTAVSVPWSSSWPLTWADFKAPAPSGGVEGAHTVYELTYEWQCRGNAFHSVVTAMFLPSRSWVKPTVVADPFESARVLGHEQTHFNLTEVFARRIRRYLTDLYNPCGQTEDRLRTAIDGYVAEEAAAQKRYDDETRFGLEPPRQRVWDHDVKEMLASLERFAARP